MKMLGTQTVINKKTGQCKIKNIHPFLPAPPPPSRNSNLNITFLAPKMPLPTWGHQVSFLWANTYIFLNERMQKNHKLQSSQKNFLPHSNFYVCVFTGNPRPHKTRFLIFYGIWPHCTLWIVLFNFFTQSMAFYNSREVNIPFLSHSWFYTLKFKFSLNIEHYSWAP